MRSSALSGGAIPGFRVKSIARQPRFGVRRREPRVCGLLSRLRPGAESVPEPRVQRLRSSRGIDPVRTEHASNRRTCGASPIGFRLVAPGREVIGRTLSCEQVLRLDVDGLGDIAAKIANGPEFTIVDVVELARREVAVRAIFIA